MLIVVQFTACRLRTCLAYACEAVINRTNDHEKFRLRAWFEFDWQPYDLKAAGHRERSARVRFWKLLRTLSELVLLSSVVLVLRHFVELIPQVYRGTGTLLFNVGHLL